MALTIRRSASYRLITRAVQHEGEPIAGLLPAGATDYLPAADADEMLTQLGRHPQAMVVYNQHPAARAMVAALVLPPEQVFVEIRQDTRGVLGLHAWQRGPTGEKTLELIYQ